MILKTDPCYRPLLYLARSRKDFPLRIQWPGVTCQNGSGSEDFELAIQQARHIWYFHFFAALEMFDGIRHGRSAVLRHVFFDGTW